MAGTSPIDAARLRAAVADRRYWQDGHPERAAWRSWVTQGFQALYSEGGQPNGGVVQVRAYMRDGQMVAAHTRGAPAGAGRMAPPAVSDIVPVMARRPEGGGIGDRRTSIPEGGSGGSGGGRPRATSGPTPAPSGPTVSARSQEIVEMIAPQGQALGARFGRSRPGVRTLPGGEPAAEAMFGRLTTGRGATDITPNGYAGRMFRLDDGTVVGYRPFTGTGRPAIDINIPGFGSITKFHF